MTQTMSKTDYAKMKCNQMAAMSYRTRKPSKLEINKAYEEVVSAFSDAGIELAGLSNTNAPIHNKVFTAYQRVHETHGYKTPQWDLKGNVYREKTPVEALMESIARKERARKTPPSKSLPSFYKSGAKTPKVHTQKVMHGGLGILLIA